MFNRLSNVKTMFLNLFVFIIASVLPVFALAASKIVIVMSVDWEGEELSSENLDAMLNFRQKYPDIKMQQFLNPAYYTEGIEDVDNPEYITQKINSVLLAGDEQGMHMHGWRQLFEQSGVDFRASPNFIDNSDDRRGVIVPLWAYTSEELSKVFASGISILQNNGFATPKSFRAGGWQASAEVIDALYNNGIEIDASAVPIKHLDYWSADNLGLWVKQLWPSFSIYNQPYLIGNTARKIIELPNNGCLADYVSGESMLEDFKTLAKTQQNSEQDIYYSIGFHQETAARYLYRVEDAVELIKEYAAAHNINYTFATFPMDGLKNSKNSLDSYFAVPAAEIN